MAGEAKSLPLDKNAVFYQQFYFQALPVLMSTNAGSLFMSFHPLWAAEGAEAVLAAQGSMAACEQPGQVGQMVAKEFTSLSIVACWLATSLLVIILQIKSVINIWKVRKISISALKPEISFPRKHGTQTAGSV